MQSNIGVEGLSGFFKEAYQRDKEAVEASKQPNAEIAPKALLTLKEQEAIRAELLERFQAERERLI